MHSSMKIHRNLFFRTFNPFVVGSTPAGPTRFKPDKQECLSGFLLGELLGTVYALRLLKQYYSAIVVTSVL